MSAKSAGSPLPMRASPPLPAGLWPAVHRLASKRPWPPDSDAEAERFLAAVDWHRLLPFAANDPQLEPALRAAALARWQPHEQRLNQEAAAFDREIAGVIDLIDADHYFFFRGAAFRRTLYPDAALRPMNDIDLITRKETRSAVIARLRCAGYRQSSIYFVREPENIKVEATALVTHETRHAIDYDEIWRERLIEPVGGPYLARHHALAIDALALGNLLYATFARRYLDLWLLTQSDAVVEAAIDAAARWKMRRMFYAAMTQLARFLQDERSFELVRRSDRLLPTSERRFVERFVIPAAPLLPLQSRPIQLLRKLALLDSSAIRARFLASQLAGRVRPPSSADT